MTAWQMLAGLAALCCSASAWADARVIDLTGGAVRTGGRSLGALVLFDALSNKDTVELPRDATLTLVFDGDGRQFLLRGPGRWRVATDTLQTLEGSASQALPAVAPALRPLAPGRSRVVAGTVAMRNPGVADLAPWPDAARLLTPPEALRWADAGAGSRYRVRMATAEGQSLYDGLQQAPGLTLPAHLLPGPGMSYAWSVEIEAGPRKGVRAFAAFSVADDATRQHWAGLLPPGDAPVSQWVLYASALEHAGFRHDARSAWQRVHEQRPDLRLTGAP